MTREEIKELMNIIHQNTADTNVQVKQVHLALTYLTDLITLMNKRIDKLEEHETKD